MFFFLRGYLSIEYITKILGFKFLVLGVRSEGWLCFFVWSNGPMFSARWIQPMDLCENCWSDQTNLSQAGMNVENNRLKSPVMFVGCVAKCQLR